MNKQQQCYDSVSVCRLIDGIVALAEAETNALRLIDVRWNDATTTGRQACSAEALRRRSQQQHHQHHRAPKRPLLSILTV